MGRSPPKYRPLLPTTPHGGEPLPAPTSTSDPVPKRKATRIACNECHEKKRKCDGQKPSCTACARHGHQCTYRNPSSTVSHETLKDELETLRGRYEILESLVTKLRVAPHTRALEALCQLRSSPSGWPADLNTPSGAQQPNSSSSMSAAKGSASPLAGSDRAACFQPLDAWDPAQDLDPPAEEPPHVALTKWDQEDWRDQLNFPGDQGSPTDAGLSIIKRASDPRLKGLNISFWTVVPVTDVFAKAALSSYLRSDHRIWELFDADVFLSDLVSQKFDFCSAFLVNCLLAFASQTYATDCPGATSKGFEFEEAAGSLRPQAGATRLDSEMALTGLILLYLCFATRWEANNADDCLRQVFEMAVRMKLFGVEERISDLDMTFLKDDRKSSMVHAAWAAFNTMSMHRRRLLSDVTSLPPLVSSPSTTTTSEVTEIDDDGVAQGDQSSQLVEPPSWEC